MQPTLTFRTGRPDEWTQFRDLALIAYGQYIPQLTTENWDLMRRNILDENGWKAILENATPFICTDGDRIAGMAFLYTSGHPNETCPANWSYIRMVGVHPEYEGLGIARKLTTQCVEAAQQAGEQTIALHTSELMNAARHIYESLGFREVQDIGKRYGIQYWLFRKDL